MARLSKDSIDRFFEHHVQVETRTIYLGDGDEGIDYRTADSVIKAVHLFTHTNPDSPVTLYINSCGGCVFNGMAIYDAVKHAPFAVNAIVLGQAMSMGSVILQAADRRIAYPNATIMVHNGYWSMDDIPQSVINWAEQAKHNLSRMYEIYAERSGRPLAFWKKQCAADYIMTAKEAKKVGLLDEIIGE